MSWHLGLLQTMRNPEYIVVKTEQLVAIKDKYPKAKNHFLVMSEEKLDTIFDLSRQHIELVREMELLGRNVIELIGQKEKNFMMGFHAEPSMIRIHLHVISKDFISPCLKNKNHWNSFATSFLWPPAKIISDLETYGKVQRLPDATVKQLLNTPLKCNSCPYLAKSIPDLKRHLLTHESLYL